MVSHRRQGPCVQDQRGTHTSPGLACAFTLVDCQEDVLTGRGGVPDHQAWDGSPLLEGSSELQEQESSGGASL